MGSTSNAEPATCTDVVAVGRVVVPIKHAWPSSLLLYLTQSISGATALPPGVGALHETHFHSLWSCHRLACTLQRNRTSSEKKASPSDSQQGNPNPGNLVGVPCDPMHTRPSSTSYAAAACGASPSSSRARCSGSSARVVRYLSLQMIILAHVYW